MKIFKEEIRALIDAIYTAQELKVRDMNITLRHYGWDGNGGCSLQQTGNEHKLTRERVRQIANNFTRNLIAAAPAHLSTLPAMMSEITRLAPASAERIENALSVLGLGEDRVEGVLRASAIFNNTGKALNVVEENGVRYLILPDMEGSSLKISAHAQKACSHLGMVNIEDLLYLLPGIPKDSGVDFIRDVLSSRDDAVWLDADKNWIWLREAPRNRLINCLMKMLSIFSSTTPEAVMVGANRYFRKGKANASELKAPLEILTAFINAWGMAEVSESGIVRKTSKFTQPARVLEFEESIVMAILGKKEKIAREKELENLLVPLIDGATHPKKHSFSMALNYSPLISKGSNRGEYVANGHI